MRNLIIILLFSCVFFRANGQQPLPDTSIFAYPIEMDEVVIKAKRGGWDVQGFIKRVQEDTTFYKAFKSLRVTSYNAVNDIRVYNKKGRVSASLYSLTRQNTWSGCREMEVKSEKVHGRFYKRNRDYKYYTAELYDYLFFTHDTICGQTDIISKSEKVDEGSMGKHKHKLKQLIFNPGSKVGGVPLMGKDAAIFHPSVAKKYDFKLASEEYEGEECYVFKAIPKAKYKNGVVYDYLATWFRKSDYSIVARDYSLSYSTFAYDFNVHMKVRTTQVGNKLLPSRIEYDGNWHVLTQKRERVKFVTSLSY